MTKQYHIETPEQLKEINAFAKSGSAAQMAAVWSAKLRKDGVSPWDKAIFAVFTTENRRKAFIGRKVGAGMTINTELKYNPALKYCEEHLKKTE